MKIQETPVLLLTGYLGSGKTTLVNRILSNKKGIKFAVIVNDIGEVNIDADLIEQGGVVGQKDDSLVALQNGCICCTLKVDLIEQLNDIVRMNKFDYIVIEASGICEPAPIAQTICAYPELYPHLAKNGIAKLDAIVTVVDALRLRDEFNVGDDLLKQNIDDDDLERLVIEQIEFCNFIVLNKAAEVSAEDLEKVKKIIRAIQPKAQILTCNYGDIDLDLILHTDMFDFEKVATSASWIAEIENHGDTEPSHTAEEHHHHHHHHHDEHEGIENEESGEALEYHIETFVYYRRPPFNLGLFDDFVARRWPKNIIRCKGICYFHDEKDKCYVFEQAGKQVQIRDAGQWYATMPAEQLQKYMAQNPGLQRDWDEQYGDRMQKLVFIGQNLDKEEIIKELDQCLDE
ncbi:CobW family GTP-binding protein [Hoylesella timonensis]|uniref:CobW/P47K family protein n=1 Tax=Hoylesella timonensis CRIS 5C-B1 TaxID=679189 RepID=D1VZ69_9BACT|nr:GTP-binding protein [Hoylesella timonensis]EFA97542.1 CobW/P47K family protein [Hoylesella timonensis CRIS 5C-B1]